MKNEQNMVTAVKVKVKAGDWIDGTIYFATIEDALESLKCDLEGETEATIKIQVVQMTEKQYEALPEFEGW